ncbi:hypothetical protein STEG23_028530 [Scotinomys teguina]
MARKAKQGEEEEVAQSQVQGERRHQPAMKTRYRSYRGETRFNKEKIIQGQGVDEPLSETGFRQAATTGQFLNNVRFTHAFSSDLTRTKQTIHGILEQSRFCKDVTVKYDSRLRERKYGIVEGKPLSEMRAMAKTTGEECPVFTPPGGETLEQNVFSN